MDFLRFHMMILSVSKNGVTLSLVQVRRAGGYQLISTQGEEVEASPVYIQYRDAVDQFDKQLENLNLKS